VTFLNEYCSVSRVLSHLAVARERSSAANRFGKESSAAKRSSTRSRDVRSDIDHRFTDLHSTTAFENPLPRPKVNFVQPGLAPAAKLLPFKRSLASVQVACGNPWCGFRWMARTCVVESTRQALDQCRRGKRALGRPAARRARTGIGWRRAFDCAFLQYGVFEFATSDSPSDG
jgi:hypothetical protein